MNREELKKYRGITGYTMGQVEKDYFQHIALGALSRKMAGFMVFKGGTALQKTGFVSRFSEDLDFTASDNIELEKLAHTVSDAIRNYNYSVDIDNKIDDQRTIGFRVKIEGPLYRNRHGICTIRVEVSKRERIVLKPDRKEFSPPYMDILPYQMNIMHIEEIFAEKVRTIFTRQKARDLYDLHMMFQKGVRFNEGLVNEKLEYYKLKFTKQPFIDRCEQLRSGWKMELESLMMNMPPYEDALDSVYEMVSEL